jgi:hypothetical protein
MEVMPDEKQEFGCCPVPTHEAVNLASLVKTFLGNLMKRIVLARDPSACDVKLRIGARTERGSKQQTKSKSPATLIS